MNASFPRRRLGNVGFLLRLFLPRRCMKLSIKQHSLEIVDNHINNNLWNPSSKYWQVASNIKTKFHVTKLRFLVKKRLRKLIGDITIHISCRRLSPLSMFGYLTFNSPTLSRTVTQSPYPRCSFHIQFAISGCYGLSQRNSYHIVYYARNLRNGWSSNVIRTRMAP